MSELSGYSEKISQAMSDWLWAEFITSGEGRNQYLDAKGKTAEEAQKKFEDLQRRLALPYDDDSNWSAQKNKSHQQQRVPYWVDAFEETSDGHGKSDYYAAQANFAPLMTFSGSYRAQCYLQASSPAEYKFLRAHIAGIDLEEAVNERLMSRNVSKGFGAAEISFSGLRRNFDYAYAQTEAYFRGMSARLAAGMDESTEDSLSVKAMKKSQTSHIQLATDCLLMAAKLRRGELESIPFLEPKSISDQSGSLYYPLEKRVNWLEVMSPVREDF